jgi:hypothetical protein
MCQQVRGWGSECVTHPPSYMRPTACTQPPSYMRPTACTHHRRRRARLVCGRRRPQELKATQGLEVHGLLVGKPSSVPLGMICDHVWDFLLKYDPTSEASLRAAAAPKRATVTLAARGMMRAGYGDEKLRIVRSGFGTARQKLALE